jgi:hypothetical protein
MHIGKLTTSTWQKLKAKGLMADSGPHISSEQTLLSEEAV